MIYLDFRKAFDSIPHPELLYKLWILGITGPLWFWFRSYLNGRSHLVNVEGSSSDLLHVRSGVPQGSVLGPLLFLGYINDLPSVIKSCSTYLSLLSMTQNYLGLPILCSTFSKTLIIWFHDVINGVFR